MPLYEFVCSHCSKEFELLVRSAAWKGEAACPRCGSKNLSKKLSVFASQTAGNSSGGESLPACHRAGGCGCRGPHHHH